MSKKTSRQLTYWLGVVAVGLILGLSIQFVRAWTEPGVAPPEGNVGAPINTSNIGQSKEGNLILNTLGTWANGLIVANGNVGIGTADPGCCSKLKVMGTIGLIDAGDGVNSIQPWDNNKSLRVNAGNNLHLIFDENGSGTGMLTINKNSPDIPPYLTITNSGNVGIETGGPIGRLDVRGGYVSFDQRFQLGNSQENWINDSVTGFSEPVVSNDGFVFVPGYTGSEDSDLRLYILDNSNDRFSIWGDSCGGGNCNELNNASLAHYFTAGGDAYHKGTVSAYSFLYSSDQSLKTDVKNIPDALDKITSLNGVSFRWKENEAPGIGLIAQDVESVFPELVSTDPNTNLKSLQYGNLVAPLIEAVKEQQRQIQILQKQVEELQSKLNELKNN